MRIMLKAQDILVALFLVANAERQWTYPELAAALRMSASEVHAALKRAVRSGLVDAQTRKTRKGALLELLEHGIRYLLPPVWSSVTRGVPTSYAAPPLSNSIVNADLPPVWPHAEGAMRGVGLAPLFKSAPDAALRDPVLHEWLALVDAVRSGRARERELAVRFLRERLA